MANPQLEEGINTLVNSSKARIVFSRIRDFFPRNDYLLRSVLDWSRQRGLDVDSREVYRSLTGKKNIFKGIEDAVLDLEEQINSHHYHDKNILPFGAQETREKIKKIRAMGKELRDWYQFKSVELMARCLEERVSTDEMPVNAVYITKLLHGGVDAIPTPEAYRVYLEMETMLDRAKRGQAGAVPLKHVVLNKKHAPSEPLDVFIRRALTKITETCAEGDIERVNKALGEFRRISRLDSMVREITQTYGFDTIKKAYAFLYDLADLKIESKHRTARPINVVRKLYAAAWMLYSIPIDTRSQIAIWKEHLVVSRDIYRKPIEKILEYGFTPTLAATMLQNKLNASSKGRRPRVTIKYVYSCYIYTTKHNVQYDKHVAMQELADRLKDVYVVDLRHSSKEKEAIARFNREYRGDRKRRVPIVVMLGRRKLENDGIINEIRAEALSRVQHAYMSTVYRGYAEKHDYLPFNDFVKFINNPKSQH